MSELAPAVLFVYNRPIHTLRTLSALSKNTLARQTEVIVYADGPKSENELENTQEVQKIVRSFDDEFLSVTLKISDQNLGLARSIIQGVTTVINHYKKIIVIEDDLVTSPQFLTFMNLGLEKYAQEERVGSIHGYMYPTDIVLPDTFFVKGGDCWGWGTWARAWDLFEYDSEKLLKNIKSQDLILDFDLDGAHPFFQMLKNQQLGKISSWAIRWHASLFLKNKLTLFPQKSLVENIGMDGTGTHGDVSSQFGEHTDPTSTQNTWEWPEKIEENAQARFAISKFWIQSKSWLKKWIWVWRMRNVGKK